MIRSMPLFALAALCTPVALVPAQAAEIQVQAQGPVVELTVSETVYGEPDVAQIGAGVTTRAASAQEAVRENARAMARVTAQLRELGIAARDIQTANFSLNPQYDYDREGGTRTFVGYDVTNQVQVKLRDLDRAGEALDALVAAGANNIYGPNFMLEADEAARREARSRAFASGQDMAREYARMAGYSDVRLLEISESFQSHGGPRPMAMRQSAESADAGTRIAPGEVGTAATVTLTFEMTR
ncbi:SIMPL domain-containing protein [Pelagerythrobacter marinus]|jgi:uncharacterized protein YggE|uniref:DUF541 domain-containing protein n=1 Tax=Pelagerythrobacter marinus TaxID=538382 RepID=A0ABW9UT76_9SPHN|nr:SIMPL domain-containing protein [Pelagerythrobacter marinus]MXO68051.1 DUF541 domain-containing protein [Pelagerythrobacter marinus]USA40785.1 SIMPL domain-containing protein [Pelagerythrobacter marinus]WPZ08041.1 SIMPL domain-containing protein [Pelagerythrobacter marinus]